MDPKQKLSIQLELLFWVFTGILIVAFAYPIYKTGADFPFYGTLALFIIVFVTITRYIFLIKFTFLAYNKWIKAICIALSAPFIFYLISQLNTFQTFYNEEGLDQFFRFMPLVERIDLQNYIRSIIVFFGTAASIAAIIFPFRLLISIWRNFNTDRA